MRNASSGDESSSQAAEPARNEVPGPSAGRVAFGLYAWIEFLLIAFAALPILLCQRGLTARRALAGRMARLALRLAGMRLQVRGLSRLPLPCVVVANHSSYLDGVVLAAVLPPQFSFVIKREMSSVPLAGLFLRRLGAQFVDRRGRGRGLGDARRLLQQASNGQALVFFPEGTFGHDVGLLPFHIGAFAAAARASLPILPIAIRGTRHCLPPGSLWPRPGAIEVQALAVLPAPASAATGDRPAALRDAARAALLAALDEPDLMRR